VKNAIAWVTRLKPVRVYQSYSLAGGNLSAAGMSFQSFFAVFAAIWVGFSISGLYLNAHPEVRNAVIGFINLQVPNLISKGGAIDPDTLFSATTLGWTGGLALIVLAYTAINWINYTRIAMHRMFGLPKPSLNFILLKLWDLVLALAYGLVIVLGSTLTVFATSLFTDALHALGFTSNPGGFIEYGIRGAVIFAVFLLDAATLGLMIRFLSGVPIPWRYMWRALILGGIALGAMKVAGGMLLGGAHKNPLYASLAIFIGLLIWFNLMCRVYLLTAEWIATGMRDDGVEPRESGWVFTRETLKKRILRRR
jgi:membrane protein